MKDIKKGDSVEVRDSDGGTTRAKVVSIRPDGMIEVKWLEARWNLNANIMVARAGTKSCISRSSIV